MGCNFYLKGEQCTFVVYDHMTGHEIGRLIVTKPYKGKAEHPISYEIHGDIRER